MLDGLSDAEWRELTELVVTCADDRLASVVHNIAGNAKPASTSVDSATGGTPARGPRQKGVGTRRLLAGGEFYRTLLEELRRQRIH